MHDEQLHIPTDSNIYNMKREKYESFTDDSTEQTITKPSKMSLKEPSTIVREYVMSHLIKQCLHSIGIILDTSIYI